MKVNMKAYIKLNIRTRGNKPNWCLVEVEHLDKEYAYGRELSIVRPVKGEGHIRINSDSIIVKK